MDFGVKINEFEEAVNNLQKKLNSLIMFFENSTMDYHKFIYKQRELIGSFIHCWDKTEYCKTLTFKEYYSKWWDLGSL